MLFSIMRGSIKNLMTWDTPMQMAEIVQRRMSQYMATRLKPIPVCTGILKAARDWRKWLDGLDLITFK